MIHRKLILAGLFAIAAAGGAGAETLNLKDGRHWIAVASTQDRDQAIGIARLYGEQARVISSQSGWFGVVLGPVKEPSLEAYRKAYQGWPEIPKDAVYSAGSKYTGTVWRPDAAVPKSVEFNDTTPAERSAGGVKVTASLVKSENGQVAHLEGRGKDGTSFSFDTPEDFYSDYGNTLLLAPLDPAAPGPEALVTQNTGGAHCCVASWIVAETSPGMWKLIDTPMLDGGGFWLEDIDGDGSYELMSVDNAFLYAFDSYAGSFAPVRIQRLRDGEVQPVDHDDAWKSRVTQDLGAMEFMARLDPSIWKTNGFLSAWVATKIELGQGDEAWAKMLKTYDRASEFGPQTCTSGVSVEDCPAENLKPIPYPEGLASFLEENGYTPVPNG
jgi:hypothetical protein